MGIGLLITSFVLGLRHGFDWDHIAAIADLSGAAENRRRGFALSMLYAVGHAIVVFALGTAAIAFGLAIPESVDSWMGRVVGITLIALGVWILVELIRKGRDFRLRSRWTLMLGGTLAGARRARATRRNHIDLSTASDAVSVTDSLVRRSRVSTALLHGHSHDHSHGHTQHQHAHAGVNTDETDPVEQRAGVGTATSIGMLHGIGIESPNTDCGVCGLDLGRRCGLRLVVLAAWVVGLLVGNAMIAGAAYSGLLQAERNFAIYAGLAIIVSLMSIALGISYTLGLENVPASLSDW